MTKSKGINKKRGYGSSGITQTRMTLMVDNDLLDWLCQKQNRTRYINDLIRNDIERNEEAKPTTQPQEEVVHNDKQRRPERGKQEWGAPDKEVFILR